MELFVFDWWWTSHQSLAYKGLRILRFCIVSWKDEREPSIKYCMGRQIDVVQKFTRVQSFGQNWWWANGIRVEHLPRIHHIAGLPQSPRVTVKIERNTREIYWKDHLHVDVQRHLMGIKRQQSGMRVKCYLVSVYAKRFGAGQWGFLGLGSEKKWYSISGDSPQGEWDKIAEEMMLTFAESGHPVFRARFHCPEGVLKSKGGGKLPIHYCADFETIETVFRTIISVTQLSLYGAVAEMCDEYESCHDRTGRPVVRGQSSPSFVTSVIKTNILLNDDPAHKEFLLQRYRERIVKLSQQDRLSKFCTDAGFLTTVEVGQYFMTKDTEEFSQFTESVACREYTLPRDEKSSDPKGWIRGNTKIGPVLEVTTSYLQGKHGVEIRIKSANKDNSHSWVRIFSWLE